MASLQLPAIISQWRRHSLFDPSPGAGWADQELVDGFNEAVQLVAALKPETFVVVGTVELAAGSEQELPAGAMVLISIPENASGEPITLVDDELLDEMRRYHGSTPDGAVLHYTVDPRMRTHFRVWPPNDGTGEVTARYGVVPAAATLATAAADLPNDDLMPILRLYTLSILYGKPGPRQDLNRAAQALQEAMAMITGKTQGGVAAVAQEAA